MTRYAALSRSEHAGTRWRRPPTYAFARGEALVRLAADEALVAAAHLPIAFAQQDGRLTTFVLAGLLPGQSLLVSADGQWQADYIPAALRVYPFALAGAPGDPEPRPLCFDLDSGLLSTDADAEVLIDSASAPGPLVQRALVMLQHMDRGLAKSAELAAALQAAGVLVPWRITVEDGSGKREVEGLWTTDPARLDALGDADILALQRSGALPLAMAQLVSKGRMNLLARVAREAAAPAAAAAPLPVSSDGDLDIEFLSRGGTLSLGGLS